MTDKDFDTCICPICGHDNQEDPCAHLILSCENLDGFVDESGGVLSESDALDPLIQALDELNSRIEELDAKSIETVATDLSRYEVLPLSLIHDIRDQKWIGLKHFEPAIIHAIEHTKGYAGHVDDRIDHSPGLTWSSRNWFAKDPTACVDAVSAVVKPFESTINNTIAPH